MILYTNGDSHTAAAECVNNHAFAQDDQKYFMMGRAPHPDNLRQKVPVQMIESCEQLDNG